MSADIQRIDRDSGRYPDLLRVIPDPPALLYARGAFMGGTPTLAIVGTRRPTLYGRRAARNLAAACAGAGITVVSGLARGIDTEAHRAALEAGGTTWAVLGSGIDRIYPPENRGLAERIVSARGALISEQAPGTPPLAHHFPPRNRIISGLSWGVVVVEGGLRSGTLITAKAALEQGREVFAVPGPVDSPMSEGPHRLLRSGACLARGLEDILHEIAAFRGLRPAAAAGGSPVVTLEDKKILNLLGSETLSFEELLSRTDWPLPRMAQVLTGLETQGIICALPGQRYGRS